MFILDLLSVTASVKKIPREFLRRLRSMRMARSSAPELVRRARVIRRLQDLSNTSARVNSPCVLGSGPSYRWPPMFASPASSRESSNRLRT
jgi:hypothetical protein